MSELPPTLAGLESLAEQTVEPGAWAYFAGGAGDETTLADNVAAWRRHRLLPRVLAGVGTRAPGVTLLGRERAHPLVTAPMAFQRCAHPDGEVALARGAAATSTPYCLSTLATTSIAELASQVPAATRWFQLYVFRDRGVSRAQLAAAAEAGYEAVVLTVDLPVFGRRDRDLGSGFRLPAVRTVPQAAAAGAVGELSPAQFADLLDPDLTWADLAELCAGSPLPVVVKGVLAAADAQRAVEQGAAAVAVSNHGGRQLDTVPATADVLSAVVDAVAGAVDVLADGGVRRGTDVATALALGASAVMVGRPLLWGLAAGGATGVQHAIEILLAELDVALALVGVPRARDLDRRALHHP